MDETKISWAGSTWNVGTGCTEVSAGCDHCYARVIAEKFGPPAYPKGFEPTWRPAKLRLPYKWKDPRRIFVNSMSDLFHRAFTYEQIATVFAVMASMDRHIYQVLTKRVHRMSLFVDRWLEANALDEVPRHIWLGVSIEQDRYCDRADELRRIPVPIRFISAEPLLEPLPKLNLDGISWLIAGGESGSGFRPMDPQWARDLRDLARDAGVPFFFKQSAAYKSETWPRLDGVIVQEFPA